MLFSNAISEEGRLNINYGADPTPRRLGREGAYVLHTVTTEKVFYFSTYLSLAVKSGRLIWVRHVQQPQEQRYSFCECVWYFRVSEQWYGCQSSAVRWAFWAIQAGLLTPLTFARHRLSPLAAFTSGAYFLHNGRRRQ